MVVNWLKVTFCFQLPTLHLYNAATAFSTFSRGKAVHLREWMECCAWVLGGAEAAREAKHCELLFWTHAGLTRTQPPWAAEGEKNGVVEPFDDVVADPNLNFARFQARLRHRIIPYGYMPIII